MKSRLTETNGDIRWLSWNLSLSPVYSILLLRVLSNAAGYMEEQRGDGEGWLPSR